MTSSFLFWRDLLMDVWTPLPGDSTSWVCPCPSCAGGLAWVCAWRADTVPQPVGQFLLEALCCMRTGK